MGLASRMKGRVFLCDQNGRRKRAALVIDGRLEAIEIDVLGDAEPKYGAVYHAKVTERIPAMGAAFMDLDGARGFLPDAADIQPGDFLTVQVRRIAEGAKAARVSTDIQIPHLCIVHTPQKSGINISKKISNPEQRTVLKKALEGLSGGFVIRTAAMDMSSEDLRTLAVSLQLPDCIQPGLLRPGPDALERLYQSHEYAPPEYDFDHYDIEEQIDALLLPQVPLPEGAWMTIEPTAALIAIDINSGKARNGDALQRVNLSAAVEIPRQLRLRHLGGAVAIDFAGEPKGKARKRLESVLAPSYKPLGWGPAGWMELQIRKPGRSLADLIRTSD